uniref:Amiloride-sensitive sodium channel n=1 Tax=Haemonchus contortus TaxID=6289 RepID=A0A7I5EEU8_HAECO
RRFDYSRLISDYVVLSMPITGNTENQDESGTDADDNEDYEDEEEGIQNIYLHVCNEEGQEFAGVTTFHGMIRIFTSRTWTSLIFWVLVVSTCLVFFMIFSGYILSNYANANTFMRRYSDVNHVDNVFLLICGSLELASQHVYAIPRISSVHIKDDCLTIEAHTLNRRLSIVFQQDVAPTTEISLVITSSSITSRHPVYLRSRHHHRIFVEATQISRLNTTRAPCVNDFWELSWIRKGRPLIEDLEPYSLQKCERMQAIEWTLQEKGCVPMNIIESTTLPSCPEGNFQLHHSIQKAEWRIRSSYSRISRGLRISLEFNKKMEVLVEVRKMGITDVLSFVGGGTSLFLGCSCVTLMETFVFLLKLVIQSINKASYEGVGADDETKVECPVAADSYATQTLQSNQHIPPKAPSRDDMNEGDVIGSTMPASPHKSIHCVRFLQSDEIVEDETHRHHYRPRPPSLSELKFNSTFNEMDTHNIERSLKNLPLSQRLTFDGNMERRRLKRQCAVDIPDDKLDQYLSEPTCKHSFCDDFDRKHPARLKIRRISSVTSRGSTSSSRANVHIVEHPRRRSQIYNKFMTMNDF